jgi:peptidoglycan DL-endopeptidase CwlO
MFILKRSKTNMLQNVQSFIGISKKASALTVLAVAITVTVGMSIAPRFANALTPQEELNVLQQENANNKGILAQLKNEAVSYQDAVARLQSQITLLQGQIDANIAQQNDLKLKIEQNQRELDRQRKVLGENLKTMYLEGQISTIEMLATSKNLSDFVDKEEYRTAVKNNIQETLKKIAVLQNELRTQEQLVTTLLNEQRASQATLTAARAEQQSMLNYNQSQQAAYNKKTKENQARIEYLIAQQRRANESASDGGYYFLRFAGGVGDFDPGNYPYRNAGFGMSTAPGCVDNDGPDRWGYCTRQCVSYAAWAVEASGRTAPKYYGNAKNWVAAARRDGVSIYGTPKVGDVAISTGGTWGHAMYVEAVDGDRMWVSQYNQQLTGQYSTQWRDWR